VMRDAMGLALAGVGAGLVLALLLGQLVRGLLFDVGPSDPVALAIAALSLLAAAALAAWLPARRAFAVPPASVLRGE
jgi:putative ABC transport system permease protein